MVQWPKVDSRTSLLCLESIRVLARARCFFSVSPTSRDETSLKGKTSVGIVLDEYGGALGPYM